MAEHSNYKFKPSLNTDAVTVPGRLQLHTKEGRESYLSRIKVRLLPRAYPLAEPPNHAQPDHTNTRPHACLHCMAGSGDRHRTGGRGAPHAAGARRAQRVHLQARGAFFATAARSRRCLPAAPPAAPPTKAQGVSEQAELRADSGRATVCQADCQQHEAHARGETAAGEDAVLVPVHARALAGEQLLVVYFVVANGIRACPCFGRLLLGNASILTLLHQVEEQRLGLHGAPRAAVPAFNDKLGRSIHAETCYDRRPWPK